MEDQVRQREAAENSVKPFPPPSPKVIRSAYKYKGFLPHLSVDLVELLFSTLSPRPPIFFSVVVIMLSIDKTSGWKAFLSRAVTYEISRINVSRYFRSSVTYKSLLLFLGGLLVLSFMYSQPPFRQVPHLWIQPTLDHKYARKKNSRKFQKAKLEFATHRQLFIKCLHCTYNYLLSFYIV